MHELSAWPSGCFHIIWASADVHIGHHAADAPCFAFAIMHVLVHGIWSRGDGDWCREFAPRELVHALAPRELVHCTRAVVIVCA